MEEHRILVVDDEPNVCEVVTVYLAREGFLVDACHDGLQALEYVRKSPPDLIVLDLMLPGLDGREVCRRIRGENAIPILMLTALDEDEDKVLGLDIGADDYLTKPFNPHELVARVKAILRRAGPGLQSPDQFIDYHGIRIDLDRRRAFVDGTELVLRRKEFDLLVVLASSPSRVFTREELIEQVWGYDFAGDERTVDVHVQRLRKKIDTCSTHRRYLQTVWGVGYKFVGTRR